MGERDRANVDIHAQIKVNTCGVCGTDLHIHEGEFIAKFPVVPGKPPLFPSSESYTIHHDRKENMLICDMQATKLSAKSPPSAPKPKTSRLQDRGPGRC